MSQLMGNKAFVIAMALAGLGAMGCEVDTVVYEPHPRAAVVVDEPPPPPPQDVIVEGPAVESEVVVEPPPPIRIETPGRPPHEGYAWVGGFWDRRGGRYVWVGGHWDRPPRGHGHWTAAHWERHGNGYIRIEGRWD